MKIVHLSKGMPKAADYRDKTYVSGIWKEKTQQLQVTFDNIVGDDVQAKKNHGGPDRVVSAYPYEHYAYWEEEFGAKLEANALGENLTVQEMLEDQVCIGDIYQIGTAQLQVCQGRYPCATINKRNQNDRLLKRIFETGFTGYFFRVMQEGVISEESTITQLFAHPKQITVAKVHRVYFDPDAQGVDIQNILSVAELAGAWRDLLVQKLLK